MAKTKTEYPIHPDISARLKQLKEMAAPLIAQLNQIEAETQGISQTLLTLAGIEKGTKVEIIDNKLIKVLPSENE